jgi:uncharacterized membrane protein
MFVAKISYLYFVCDMSSSTKKQRTHNKAQMVAFVLMANMDDRLLSTMAFNDQIMMLYLLVCIYYCINNHPLKASAFLAIALSIKSGAFLFVPSFLGVIFINYGTFALFKSLNVLIWV